ncbi:MAG: FtsX-like permease family protein [Clostridium sp.]
MLKNFNHLTFKYLQKNKMRTRFTLIGISLSMTLITLGCLFIPTAKNIVLNQVRAYEGSWHISYGECDKDFTNKIKFNPKVEDSLKLVDEDSINIKNATLNLKRYDGDIENIIPINLKEGRLPNNNEEVIIDYWVPGRLNDDIKLGDNIAFNNRKLKVVGLLQGDPSNTETIAYTVGKVDSDSSLFVKLKEDKYFRENIEEFKGKKDEHELNTELTNILAADKEDYIYKSIVFGVSIFIFVILISTIAIIYNSFNISVMQRSKEIAVLRTLGSTPKQIRRLFRREGFILASIGIPIGILLGIGLLQLLIGLFNNLSFGLRAINGNDKLQLVLDYRFIILSALIGFVTIYIASLIPSRKAGKISPMDMLNFKGLIIKEKINKRTGKIIKRFCKIDILMSYRNLKRNRGRNRITILSISISVVIFFVMCTLGVGSMDIVNMQGNISKDINIIAYINTEDESGFNKINDEINKLDEIDKSYIGYNPINYTVLIPENLIDNIVVDSIKTRLQGGITEYNGEKYVYINTSIGIYDKSRMEEAEKYLVSGKINDELINNGEILIVRDGFTEVNNNRMKVKISSLTEKDKLDVNLLGYIAKSEKVITEYGYEDSYFGTGECSVTNLKEDNILNAKIAGVIDNTPFDLDISNSLGIIMTPETAELWISEYYKQNKDINKRNWIKENKISKDYLEIILKDSNSVNDTILKIEDILIKNGVQGHVVNIVNKNAIEKSSILLISIIGGGFTLMIALIGAINIFNTINTNISLRKREFISLISVGMPMKKICNMIIFEGVIYALISTVIGSVIGILLCYKMLKSIILYSTAIKAVVIMVLVSIIFTMILSVCATLPGVKRLKKINIIDELKKDN